MAEKREPTKVSLNQKKEPLPDSAFLDFNSPEEVQDLRKRRFFRILVICLFLLITTDAATEFLGRSASLPDYELEKFKVSKSYGDQSSAQLVNPELSWFERNFCSGIQVSILCPERTLHPIAELIEPYDEGDFSDFLNARGAALPAGQRVQPGTREATISKRQGKYRF